MLCLMSKEVVDVDTELVERAKSLDEIAFLTLIQTVQNDLYRTAFAFLQNEHDALEAVQEVTVRVYQQLPKLRQPAYAKTWMIRIMINYCHDQLKRKRQVLPLFNAVERGQTRAAEFPFFELIQTLPKDRQRLLYYRYYIQASIEEIAAIETIPVGTVKSRIHKSLELLRNKLTNQGGDRDVFERQLDFTSSARTGQD